MCARYFDTPFKSTDVLIYVFAYESRLVLLQWLVDFSKSTVIVTPAAPMSSVPNIMHTRFAELQPRAYDPLRLKEVKLLALLHCFSPAACTPADELSPTSLSTPVATTVPIDKLFDMLEDCFGRARNRPQGSTNLNIALKWVLHLLHTFPGRFLQRVSRFFMSSVGKSGEVLWSVVQLLDLYMHPRSEEVLCPTFRVLDNQRMSQQEGLALRQKVGLQFLVELCQNLPRSNAAAAVLNYFPVLIRLVQRKSTQFTSSAHALVVLKAVFAFVRRSAVCRVGEWAHGDAILRVAKEVMLNPPLPHEVRMLCARVLRVLCIYFPDEDIRDRARLYGAMLSRLKDSVLQRVLAGKIPSEKRCVLGSAVRVA